MGRVEPMKIGILGSGDVARALGAGFIATGHTVRLGSRTPESAHLVEWKKQVGPSGSSGTFASAAEFGELLVLCTHGVDTPSAIQLAGPRHFDGKVVIDVTNPLQAGPGGAPALTVGFTDSAGEQVQRLLPAAKVVKAFNIVGSPHMFRPQFPGGPPSMFFCGNDADAKRQVAGILTSFGWSPIDIGSIEGARLLEPMCILWVTCGLRLGNWNIAFTLLRK
jgi:8-hydroxy-5-deazaflavin:NADPH oxidoreductase